LGKRDKSILSRMNDYDTRHIAPRNATALEEDAPSTLSYSCTTANFHTSCSQVCDDQHHPFQESEAFDKAAHLFWNISAILGVDISSVWEAFLEIDFQCLADLLHINDVSRHEVAC